MFSRDFFLVATRRLVLCLAIQQDRTVLQSASRAAMSKQVPVVSGINPFSSWRPPPPQGAQPCAPPPPSSNAARVVHHHQRANSAERYPGAGTPVTPQFTFHKGP